MTKFKQTNDDKQYRQYEASVEGEVAIGDPLYMRPGAIREEIRDNQTFVFEATGTWDVMVEPLMTVPDHRNGALIAVRSGTDQKAGEWVKREEGLFVDAGLMSFFPLERGEITDVNSFLDALEEATAAEHGMAILEEVEGILVCSSGLGDGVYSVSVRKGAGDAIDGVKVDFTPSAAAMSLLYDLG